LTQSTKNSIKCPNPNCPDNVGTVPATSNIVKHGKGHSGRQRYRCKTCTRTFSDPSEPRDISIQKSYFDINSLKKGGSNSAWLLYHLHLPLLPFFLGAMVRCLGSYQISFTAFSASELALIMAMVMFFVYRSLAEYKAQPIEVDKKEEIEQVSGWSFYCTIPLIAAFAAIELLKSLIQDSENKIPEGQQILTILEMTVFAGAVLLAFHVYRIQRSFELKVYGK